MIDFKEKKVAIAGFGVEGRATANYLLKQKAYITILDQNTELKKELDFNYVLGDDAFSNLNQFDYVFRTAGLRPEKLHCSPDKILTVYKLLLSEHRRQIIGVTGTKGKGTTSALIHAILTKAGQKSFLGGNIGVHPLDFFDQITDKATIVLELSSFQLFDVQASPRAAVVLMVEPDHLDWHRDMTEYVEAKKNIVRYQIEFDLTVYNPDNSNSISIVKDKEGALPFNRGNQGHVSGGIVKFAEVEIISVNKVGLLGPHNLDNICAATTVCWHWLKEKNLPEETIKKAMAEAIEEFKGLEHRLERVTEVNGVSYINDTFSANPIALQAALSSFSQPKVVIVGGFDKKIGVETVVASLIQHLESIRHIVLIGQTAQLIAEGLQSAHVENYSLLPVSSTMDRIVACAAEQAQKGDVVLLSPGHASFDMFKNYKDRGEKFRQAVKSLS